MVPGDGLEPLVVYINNYMTTTYSSPLCSCVHCKEVKSAKGIYSHYLTAHTSAGTERLAKSRINSIQSAVASTASIMQARIDNYNKNPSNCKCCQRPLSYKERNKIFCNSSCAATYNNYNRTVSKSGPSTGTGCRSQVRFLACAECGKKFVWNDVFKGSKKYCSKECKNAHQFESKSTSAKLRNFGGVRPSKRILYNGTSLGSTYEVQLAKILDKLKINWSKSPKFNYTVNSITRTYEPDLYLPDYNLFLDPKNDFLIHNVNPVLGFKDMDKIAWVVEQNNISIAIIDKEHLTEDNILKLVGQAGFEPAVILSCKDSGFGHSHHCPVVKL